MTNKRLGSTVRLRLRKIPVGKAEQGCEVNFEFLHEFHISADNRL